MRYYVKNLLKFRKCIFWHKTKFEKVGKKIQPLGPFCSTMPFWQGCQHFGNEGYGRSVIL